MRRLTTDAHTVLIVEDDPLTLKALLLAVRAAGYTAFGAGDGVAALAMFTELKPDLACLDLMLPDMDGVELARRIRELPNGADVILIALSGLTSKLEEACTLSRGFSDMIFKPIEPTKLTERLGRLLPVDSAESHPAMQGRILLVDDDPTQRKLARLWLSQHGFDVRSTSSAREALHLAVDAPPDAIVSDLVMPDMDGLSLCRAIRDHPRLATIPFVLTSSYSPHGEAEQETARLAGVNAFVPRTPTLDRIVDALRGALSGALPIVPQPQPSSSVASQYSARAIRQLKHQARLNENLARDAAAATAQLSILTAVAIVAADSQDLNTVLREALARTLEAAEVSQGAIYLFEADGRLQLMCHAGAEDPLAQSPALSKAVTERRRTKTVAPSRDSRMAVVPIIAAGEHLGVLCLCPAQGRLTNRLLDVVSTISAQLAPAVALARSIARLSESERCHRVLLEREQSARAAAELANAEAQALAASLEQANSDLQRLAATAEKENCAKAEFLAVMSHELRTPLNALGGYSQLLEMELAGPITDAQRLYVMRIQESGHHLTRLIDHVFDFTKMDIGQMSSRLEETTIRDALDGVSVLLEPMALKRDVTLAITEHPCCRPIIADRDKLRQVLLNLGRNAIEFTRSGGCVSIDCDERADPVLVHVRDTGIGIAADQLEAIFEPFVQLDTGLTRKHGGMGLGLTICRAFAREMNGDVRAESAPGRGATFTVSLPCAPHGLDPGVPPVC
jgi:signal transduction histidine kinase/DNA-binding response OmpR family regulator